MGAPVTHWEINARDAKRLQEFYSGLFDWIVDTNNPMQYPMVVTGSDVGIGGAIPQTDPSQLSPPVIFYVEVDDPQAMLDRAMSMGGRMVQPVTDYSGMVTIAKFADPEGNTIGLIKSVNPPAPPRQKAAPKKKAKKKVKKAAPKRKAKKKVKKAAPKRKTKKKVRKVRRSR